MLSFNKAYCELLFAAFGSNKTVLMKTSRGGCLFKCSNDVFVTWLAVQHKKVRTLNTKNVRTLHPIFCGIYVGNNYSNIILNRKLDGSHTRYFDCDGYK